MLQTWSGRPPGRLDAKGITLVREGGAAPQKWIDHGLQFLDNFDACVVLYDRKAHVIHLLQDAPTEYCRYVEDVLHSTRVMAYTPDVMWLRRTKPCLDFLRKWRVELEHAPEGYEVVALTVALYRAQLAMWVLPPWREYE